MSRLEELETNVSTTRLAYTTATANTTHNVAEDD
jgi:hypothetical protein